MKLRYSPISAWTSAASRGRDVVERGNRHDRERCPHEGELAVVVVPDAREKQRPGGDGEEDAEERQRPRPAERRAVESGGRSRTRRKHRNDQQWRNDAEPNHRMSCPRKLVISPAPGSSARSSFCSGVGLLTTAAAFVWVEIGSRYSMIRSAFSPSAMSCGLFRVSRDCRLQISEPRRREARRRDHDAAEHFDGGVEVHHPGLAPRSSGPPGRWSGDP